MKRKGRRALCIACGLVCGLCVLAYTQSVRGEAEAARAEALARYGGDQVEVAVAARDIAPGSTIESGDVVMKLWVADLLPAGAISSKDEVVGKKASSSVLAGEVLSSRRFGEESAMLDVPSDMTAVSVPAREVQAVGGAVEPGMSVDVYAAGATSTELVGQGLKVLATSASASDGASITWITLAVKPSKAQEMVAYAMKTELYFTLPGEAVVGSAASAKPANAAANANANANAVASANAVANAAANANANTAANANASTALGANANANAKANANTNTNAAMGGATNENEKGN